MKIEKINDNQIRCTLSRSDLDSRNIRISELTYGNEKAQELFREMVEQADEEFGFQAEDAPIIVEAMPVAGDSLVLVITKVDNPEELDPRFARFAPFLPGDDAAAGGAGPVGQAPPAATLEEASEAEAASPAGVSRIFRFQDLDTVSDAARILQDVYFGINSLYKDPEYGDLYLVVTKAGHSLPEFNRACNILSEFATIVSPDPSVEGFFNERFTCLVENRALQVMAQI